MRSAPGLLRPVARLSCLGLLLAFGLAPAAAQTSAPAAAAAPAPYEVLAVTVEGATDEASSNLARQISGLRPGAQVQLPWDPSFSEAVRALYTRGGYSDASVVVSQVVGQGVFLTVRVTEQPKLAQYTIEGLSSGDQDDLRDQIPLLRGRAVRPADVERGKIAIEAFLRSKGYRTPVVTAAQTPSTDGRVDLVYTVERGGRQTVADVVFTGNTAFSERTLRRQLKGTPESRWWRFWKRATFNDDAFQTDLDALVRFYNDRGYYGARVVSDSVYTRPEDGGLVVQVALEEGPRYAIRNVVFEGNTLFTDAQLAAALDVQSGDVYNRTRLERNLLYSPNHTDIASLYTDRGYLRFDAQQQTTVVPGDSLDLYFEVTEGDVYEFGEVNIAGNTRTKEHVIRRELRTVPGQPYSRQAIERSVRELSTLNYFDPASFGNGPAMSVNDADQTVDLTYSLAEKSSDQLELSGGWGGGGTGLILTARVTFANFSVQNLLRGRGNPMPSGDGQQLALQVQTYGKVQQVYSLSFTEPWFRGRQTPAGFSLGYSNYQSRQEGGAQVARAFGRVFYRQRLRFPDDYFQTGSDLGLQIYDISGTSTNIGGLPLGVSRELTFEQSLTRNALDNPQLPTAGSNLGLSLTIAPPVPGFIQYIKGDLTNAWYTPIGPRLSASVRTQFGYIGSLTGEEVQFQRYLIGGTALEANQGSLNGFGKDLVFMRGYPLEAIGPRENGDPVGGRILNKYQAEIQWLALQTPQLTFAPYLFLDAANTWDSFADYDPSRLYRSAGIGARVFLPILGLVDLTYGRQIDTFDATGFGTEDGLPKWDFQFTLGGGS
ncbi:MAG TPA: outer membrane protein assembly factor BamA [Rubricoccaceae bacterium]